MRSFRYIPLKITKALPVQIADSDDEDSTDTPELVIPLQLNRQVTDDEIDLFQTKDKSCTAQGAVLYVTVDTVEDIKTSQKRWQNLVASVSADSHDIEHAASDAKHERDELLARANAEAESLRFD